MNHYKKHKLLEWGLISEQGVLGPLGTLNIFNINIYFKS